MHGGEVEFLFQAYEFHHKAAGCVSFLGVVADLPDDVIIQEEVIAANEQITIEQAKARVGEFLVMPETDGLTLELIEDMGVEETGEISLKYLRNGEPEFSLSVMKPIEALDSEDDAIEVRGNSGSKMDLEYFKLLQWDENGLRYNIIFENPELTFEEVLQLTEQMELVK